jgi:hypothetical protein
VLNKKFLESGEFLELLENGKLMKFGEFSQNLGSFLKNGQLTLTYTGYFL